MNRERLAAKKQQSTLDRAGMGVEGAVLNSREPPASPGGQRSPDECQSDAQNRSFFSSRLPSLS